MSVIETQTWLNTFVKACKEQQSREPYFIQCETLCDPLEDWFPKISAEELHYHLLEQGLFEPEEWKEIVTTVQKMEKNNVWRLVNQEYKRLKKKWNGPEAPIFIFPIKNAHLSASKNRIKKNGVTVMGAIFLFLSPDLVKEEIKAIFAHEYNHVCRLAYLNVENEKLTLKDSLIIEGLGEFAVKELYGEKWLAPWAHLYSFEEIVGLWKRHFVPSLTTMGKEKHDLFLYGNNRQLPKWIGYYIGFQIVDSYQMLHGPFKNNELYAKTSEELIAGSKFPYK
ncbi:DUF2268 domain-containing protein [Domibacillus aminovorans]|uniref:DUF2268 domain-containing protein n=1 Tax=Domibacillus aminovorans TaxID=29332 RepID=A0A177L5A6_9BACI|nr:DUF2268 domain-containing putative Zn-dependent protease [Domibacillus aminovorans]OAH60664.1 hypothetical protein AWH49_02635 [Domibacillus aminovorans]